MKISVVIPNYNGQEVLRNNFKSIVNSIVYYKKSNKEHAEIIVVDDCSDDASLSVLSDIETECKKLNIPFKVMVNNRNLGFSSTVNKGVDEARGEIVILLNTDVSPKEDFIMPLINHFSNEKVFSVGAMEESKEDGKTIERGRGLGKWEKGFLVHRRGEVDKNNTLWNSGGSSAFRKEYWNKLGGLYEVYNPFYWEDIDISYRAQKAGYKVVFEKKSVVVHMHSEGAIKSHYTEEKIKQISYKNQFYFVWINITDSKYIFNHIVWTKMYLLKSLFGKDKAFLIGFFSTFKNVFRVLQLRVKASRLFVKSDREVLSEFIS